MDFKQLEAFVHVVNLGSFSKAADQLHLTQPTISAHIRSLEEELGLQLIVRTPKHAYPTGAGKRLFGYATDMLTLRENAIATCAAKGDRMVDTLSIAASTIPYQYLLPAAMAAFREQHPNVTFQLHRYDSVGVVEAVLERKTECGIVGAVIADSNLAYREICQDELVVITPVAPPFSKMDAATISLTDMQKASFVVREPGSGTRMEAEHILREKGVDPDRLRIVAQMDNPDAVKRAVSQGLGISIVSKLSVEEFERLGLLRVFALEGGPLKRSLYFINHKRYTLSGVANMFRKFIIAQKNVNPYLRSGISAE